MIRGFVERIDTKQTQYGPMYNLVVDGKTYGVGKFAPKGIQAGDYVQFEGVQKGNFWNVQAGSLSKQDKPAGVTASPARAASGGGMSQDRRQETISKQAALNSALSFVKLLQDADALPMPKTTKQAAKADLLLTVVNDYTARFYHQSTGETFELPDVLPSDLSGAEGQDNWSEEG